MWRAGGNDGTPRHVLIFAMPGTLSRTFQFPQTPAIAQLPWKLVVHTGKRATRRRGAF
jgi:hypothetical protein